MFNQVLGRIFAAAGKLERYSISDALNRGIPNLSHNRPVIDVTRNQITSAEPGLSVIAASPVINLGAADSSVPERS